LEYHIIGFIMHLENVLENVPKNNIEH
jgi:hypothetical protein